MRMRATYLSNTSTRVCLSCETLCFHKSLRFQECDPLLQWQSHACVPPLKNTFSASASCLGCHPLTTLVMRQEASGPEWLVCVCQQVVLSNKWEVPRMENEPRISAEVKDWNKLPLSVTMLQLPPRNSEVLFHFPECQWKITREVYSCKFHSLQVKMKMCIKAGSHIVMVCY